MTFASFKLPSFGRSPAFVRTGPRGRSGSVSGGFGPRSGQTRGTPPEETPEFRAQQTRGRTTSFSGGQEEPGPFGRTSFARQFGGQGTGGGGRRGGGGGGGGGAGGGGGRHDRKRRSDGRGWDFEDRVLVIPTEVRVLLLPYVDALDELTDEQIERFLAWVSELLATGGEAAEIFVRIAARVAFNLSILKPVYDLVTVMSRVVQSGTITPGDVLTAGRALASLTGPAGPVAALARGAVPRLFPRNPTKLQVAAAAFDAVAVEYGTSASAVLQELGNAAIEEIRSHAARSAVAVQSAGPLPI
jgi:hypothetical protein